ncbi:hypothetical protein GC089_03090 [Cellulomonas sp. JZ18]|uniref:hypothetical protein n=1 Tax=Cellulomonas sp. JZ18 TaxID=2654191 RepID=UPI0012D3EA32|nr:hypothetical protein [Cellulomonas sp. JZ18]QGQ18426.1 hypothetical protein GC089_03090 [Cellulomonas sp. JZ18]
MSAKHTRTPRKLVVDPDLLMNLAGDEKAVRRARRRLVEEARAGTVIISPRSAASRAVDDPTAREPRSR